MNTVKFYKYQVCNLNFSNVVYKTCMRFGMYLNYVTVGVFRVHADPHSEERLSSVWA